METSGTKKRKKKRIHLVESKNLKLKLFFVSRFYILVKEKFINFLLILKCPHYGIKKVFVKLIGVADYLKNVFFLFCFFFNYFIINSFLKETDRHIISGIVSQNFYVSKTCGSH